MDREFESPLVDKKNVILDSLKAESDCRVVYLYTVTFFNMVFVEELVDSPDCGSGAFKGIAGSIPVSHPLGCFCTLPCGGIG